MFENTIRFYQAHGNSYFHISLKEGETLCQSNSFADVGRELNRSMAMPSICLACGHTEEFLREFLFYWKGKPCYILSQLLSPIKEMIGHTSNFRKYGKRHGFVQVLSPKEINAFFKENGVEAIVREQLIIISGAENVENIIPALESHFEEGDHKYRLCKHYLQTASIFMKRKSTFKKVDLDLNPDKEVLETTMSQKLRPSFLNKVKGLHAFTEQLQSLEEEFVDATRALKEAEERRKNVIQKRKELFDKAHSILEDMKKDTGW